MSDALKKLLKTLETDIELFGLFFEKPKEVLDDFEIPTKERQLILASEIGVSFLTIILRSLSSLEILNYGGESIAFNHNNSSCQHGLLQPPSSNRHPLSIFKRPMYWRPWFERSRKINIFKYLSGRA